VIVTERLVLRPFRGSDLPAFVAYRSDPEVARYQGWDASFSMADAVRFLAEQDVVGLGARGTWTQLAAVDRVDGTRAATARRASPPTSRGRRRSASRSRVRARGAATPPRR
jgi:Acetyltransferase (GNAT) domain